MSIEQAIYQRLSTHTPLVALTEGRIYPTVPSENAQLPTVVYSVTSSEPQMTTTGVTALTKFDMQLDIWAVNLDDALQVGNEVKSALHGYRGGQLQGVFLTSKSLQQEDEGYHEQQSYTAWASTGATFADAGTLAANTIFAPRLTKITDWTVHFTTSPNPERLGVFKYVSKRNKAHRRSPPFAWSGTPYTPHKGKRWEQVFELATTATTWTYPTDFSQSIRPHDNDPWTVAPLLNLRTTGKSKRWRIGAMHGGGWHLSPEVLLYSVPDAFSRANPNFTKLGLVS